MVRGKTLKLGKPLSIARRAKLLARGLAQEHAANRWRRGMVVEVMARPDGKVGVWALGRLTSLV